MDDKEGGVCLCRRGLYAGDCSFRQYPARGDGPVGRPVESEKSGEARQCRGVYPGVGNRISSQS